MIKEKNKIKTKNIYNKEKNNITESRTWVICTGGPDGATLAKTTIIGKTIIII